MVNSDVGSEQLHPWAGRSNEDKKFITKHELCIWCIESGHEMKAVKRPCGNKSRLSSTEVSQKVQSKREEMEAKSREMGDLVRFAGGSAAINTLPVHLQTNEGELVIEDSYWRTSTEHSPTYIRRQRLPDQQEINGANEERWSPHSKTVGSCSEWKSSQSTAWESDWTILERKMAIFLDKFPDAVSLEQLEQRMVEEDEGRYFKVDASDLNSNATWNGFESSKAELT